MRKQTAYDMSIASSMASAKPSLFMILEKLQVAPAFTSPESAAEFSLPLTFFDTLWFKFPPVERLFFYELAKPPAYFYTVVLPKLKESLSCTLVHFLPLAGSLIWPPESEPIILYSPNDGSVSLTVAESNIEDYDRLCGKEIQEASDSRPYLPELPVSETKASVIALQITLFPNKGFSIGIISHHAILDGKSAIMFFKTWAYLCNLLAKDQPHDQLPDELVPFFDRDGIHDVAGLKSEFLNQWSYQMKSDSSSNPRSLKPWSNTEGVAPETVRGTFELTRQDIGKLRQWVSSQLNIEGTIPVSYLSTFVLVCAYTSVCSVKARQVDGDRDVWFGYSVDSRSRLDPPLPQNYFGNSIAAKYFFMKAREFMDENGVAMVAKRIGRSINDLEKGLLEGVNEFVPHLFSLGPETQWFTVAGSNRFGVYGSDFGWGRPKKVEITSIDRTGAMSMAESRDGKGGVEIGLALKRHELEAFVPLFVNGLKEL